MAAFVLVHGAWHGGWCWERLAPLLRAAGHVVYAPTLAGLAERADERTPQLGLATHAREVADLLTSQDLRAAILVGHSYGGPVCLAALETAAARVRWLVLLDAPLLDSGQTVGESLDPAAWATMRKRTDREGHGWLMPPNSPAQLGITDPADQAWVAERVTPQPLRTFTEPLCLTSAVARSVPRAYIFCTPARPGSRLIHSATAAQSAGWWFREIATGHDAMLTAPRALAACLLDLAIATDRE